MNCHQFGLSRRATWTDRYDCHGSVESIGQDGRVVRVNCEANAVLHDLRSELSYRAALAAEEPTLMVCLSALRHSRDGVGRELTFAPVKYPSPWM